jgi:plastocyanin
MEVVQEVSVQVDATKLGDLRGLIDDLEAHRRNLRGVRGFVGMQITRATEPGGNVLLTVSTRWKDNNSLSDYTTQPETVTSIIERHGDITVPGTLETRRVEAVESRMDTGNVPYERFGIALGVPLVIVGIGLGVIYALSRVYLELESSAGATTLAAAVAISILLGAWYFASNRVPQWQYAAAVVGVGALLLGGTVFAQVSPGPTHEEEHVDGSPTPGEGETPTAPGAVSVELNDNYFTIAGSDERNPTITIPSGTEIPLDNVGTALHNMHIEPSPGAGFAVTFCRTGEGAPCSDPARIPGGNQGVILVSLPPGTYTYRCDFHTQEMVGQITVQ